MNHRTLGMTLLALLAARGGVHAAEPKWSLEERSYFEGLEHELGQYASLAAEACGATLSLQLDKPSFRGRFNSEGRTGVDGLTLDRLATPLREVRLVCLEGKNAARAVADGIQSVRIGLGAKADQRLESGTLHVTVPVTAQGSRDWSYALRAWIKKQL
jgi:hypothetical protein